MTCSPDNAVQLVCVGGPIDGHEIPREWIDALQVNGLVAYTTAQAGHVYQVDHDRLVYCGTREEA